MKVERNSDLGLVSVDFVSVPLRGVWGESRKPASLFQAF
ncbi:hypothetical protein APA_1307 [Pseudanabaena sp. lw0831]|nr:hypothetical protein APA_1307 [Pseudanabaena sp. lw0831]